MENRKLRKLFVELVPLCIGFLQSGVFFASTNVLASESKELARVNGIALSEADLTASIAAINEAQRENFLRTPANRKEALDELVNQEVLVQEAQKLKFEQETAFKASMQAYKRQLLVSLLLEKKLSTQLSEEAAQRYFQDHKDEFSPNTVRVQHLVVPDESEAKRLLKLARTPNVEFQDLAEKYSKDPAAKNNRGELGYVRKGFLDPAFVDAAWSGTPGSVVGPVKTLFGFHLIKVIDKRFGKMLEYTDVQLQVRAALRAQLLKTYIDNLRQQFKVSVNAKALEHFN